MRDLSDLPETIRHTFGGIDYDIMPDLALDEDPEWYHIVVIGSHPKGRYRTPITINPLVMGDPIWKDRVCRMNLRAYTKAEQSQNVLSQTETK